MSNTEEKAKKLISFSQVSMLLTGNDNSIRKNKVPERYKEEVEELLQLIGYWVKKHGK